MTNAFSLFRSLIIYSIVLPVAAVVGYLLATPLDSGSFVAVALLLCFLTIPLFLKWHYPWLLLSWNMSAIFFFLPGKPFVCLLMVMISFGISFLQYILNRQMKFISVPAVARPLLFILVVVLLTARLTGGIGLNALGGGENIGGRRYIALILAVMGFFALVAVKIPPQKRRLYVFLYFGGTLSMAIANLAYVVSPGLSFIFLVFPTDQGGINALSAGTMVQQAAYVRLGGLSTASVAIVSLMLAFYGVRGFLDFRRAWRLGALFLLMLGVLLGGYRSQIIIVLLTLGLLFYLEGLARSRLLPMLFLGFILSIAVALPFARSMPLVFQRSLAFLPIDLDPDVVASANGSTEWRLEMWSEVLPLVPQYLILGKGLGISGHEMDMVRANLTRGESGYVGSMMAGDYHSGPLSLIIPFGIFGVIGFIWFLTAATKVVYRNYKYGDPEILGFNRFLYAQFVVKILLFFFIFGSFYADLFGFVGIVGFSIALNHGVASPAVEPVKRPIFNKFKLANAVR